VFEHSPGKVSSQVLGSSALACRRSESSVCLIEWNPSLLTVTPMKDFMRGRERNGVVAVVLVEFILAAPCLGLQKKGEAANPLMADPTTLEVAIAPVRD
jgi:hypothetical protein